MKGSFFIKLYLAALVVFLGLDSIWLVVVAQSFYQEQVGFLLAKEPNLAAATLFYGLFVFGLLYFVVLPALKVKKIELKKVVGAGGLFGLITYATYDLTNLATVAGWPVEVTVIDLMWGTFLAATVATASFLIGRKIQ